MEDQIQIEEENQVGDRPRAVAAPSQLTSISGISDKCYNKDRAGRTRNKEEAIKLHQKKKPMEKFGQVEYAKHKKQKSQHREMMSTPKKLEKRDIVEVEEAAQADSSKRQKSEGQDGCKQLGCSTHKGIS